MKVKNTDSYNNNNFIGKTQQKETMQHKIHTRKNMYKNSKIKPVHWKKKLSISQIIVLIG